MSGQLQLFQFVPGYQPPAQSTRWVRQLKFAQKIESTGWSSYKKDKANDAYKQITFFKDRQGKAIAKSLVFEQVSKVWSNNWTQYKPRDDIKSLIETQINRRVYLEGEGNFRRNVRGETFSNKNIEKRLRKGLYGEGYTYETLSKLQFHPEDIGIPRDDGASWFADIPTFSGDFIECKTTEGNYIPGQYRRLLKEKDDKKKQREYFRNSPSYCLNVADKHGNKVKGHACKAARGESFPNEFFMGLRHRVRNGKHQYKISFIIRMIDLERKFEVDGKLTRVFDMVVVPWDDNRDHFKEFVNGKARLVEELLIETFTKYDIPFYRPIDNQLKSNGFVFDEKESPSSVLQIEKVTTSVKKISTGAFDSLFDESDSDEEDD